MVQTVSFIEQTHILIQNKNYSYFNDKQWTVRLILRERCFEATDIIKTDQAGSGTEDMSTHINCDLCALALGLALHIFATQCYKKDESAVHCCDLAWSVLIMSGVSKHLSGGISLAVHCWGIYHGHIICKWWATAFCSSVRPTMTLCSLSLYFSPVLPLVPQRAILFLLKTLQSAMTARKGPLL